MAQQSANPASVVDNSSGPMSVSLQGSVKQSFYPVDEQG
jgi:hypothetical protein